MEDIVGRVAVLADRSRRVFSALFGPKGLFGVMYNRDKVTSNRPNMSLSKSDMGRGWGQDWFLCHQRVMVVRGRTTVTVQCLLVKKNGMFWGMKVGGSVGDLVGWEMRQRRRQSDDISPGRGWDAVFR